MLLAASKIPLGIYSECEFEAAISLWNKLKSALILSNTSFFDIVVQTDFIRGMDSVFCDVDIWEKPLDVRSSHDVDTGIIKNSLL